MVPCNDSYLVTMYIFLLGKKPWKLDRGKSRDKKKSSFKRSCSGDDVIIVKNKETGNECGKTAGSRTEITNFSASPEPVEQNSVTGDITPEVSPPTTHTDANTSTHTGTHSSTAHVSRCLVKSRSADEVTQYSAIESSMTLSRCHRVSMSRSVDDIHYMKKCTQIAASLFQVGEETMVE